MKITIFLLFIPICLFAQKKDTTIIDVNGLYREIVTEYNEGVKYKETYSTKNLKALKINKEELFMRGIIVGEDNGYISSVDSVIRFHHNGIVEYKEYWIGELIKKWYTYDENWKIVYVKVIRKNELLYLIGKNQELSISKKVINIEGRYGNEETYLLDILNEKTNDIKVELRYSNQFLDFNFVDVISASEHVRVPIPIQFRYENIGLGVDVYIDSKHVYTIPLNMRIFDLNDENFQEKKELNDDYLNFSKSRDRIIIALEMNEKILNIYEGNKLLMNLPISRIRNKIDLSLLKIGKYIFETHDLSNDEKRYCLIEII